MKKSNKSRIIALACCMVLLVSALIGGGLAKYTTQVKSEGPGETFNVQLFDESAGGEFKLEEDKNKMATNGAYDTLESESAVTENEYIMIPGTSNLKYPYISYTNKTSIPAYLYLVVGGSGFTRGEFEFAIDETIWARVAEDESGRGNGVFVYAPNRTPVKLTNETDISPAPIMAKADNEKTQVYITKLQKLLENKTIEFTAYAIQAPGETATVADAKSVWNANKDGSNELLIDTTAKVVNTFIPGEVKSSVVENGGSGFDGTTKSSVQIKNEGNVPALVRARLVVNWIKLGADGKPELDAAGNPKIVADPQGVTDPTVNNIDTTKWTTIGDYYYYNGFVQPGEMTPDLLKNAITAAGTPAGYQLQIEVIAEAIQATGYSDPVNPSNDTMAVALAWVDTEFGGHYYDAASNKWLPDNYR